TLSTIEWACNELYTTSNQSTRIQAEETCSRLIDRSDCIATCKALLERANSCYSQYIAASTLTRFISNRDTVVHVSLRLQLRNFALNYLATQPNLQAIVQQALIGLICRLTKIGWFDSVENGPEYPFRDIFDSVKNFIQSGQIQPVLVGVKLLSSLVSEIYQSTESDLARATFFVRKLLVSFRDLVLFQIFQLGLDLLHQTDANLKNLTTNDADQLQVVYHTLNMVYSCLNYDFIGTGSSYSEGGNCASDDMGTVQLPANWRPIFLESNNVDLFFRLFAGLPQAPTCSNLRVLPLSCLVQITSIRRTLFTNEERPTLLASLMMGCLEVLRRRESLLCEPTVYHEFCRLLSRMKVSFQVSEFVQISCYSEFIKLVADLTTHSLYNFTDDSDFNNSNSLYYLMMLWQRLVASIPYARTSQPYLIDTYAPQVTRAYIESRLAGVPRYADSISKAKPLRITKKTSSVEKSPVERYPSVDDPEPDETCPLDDNMTLSQQLDQFSIIGRCDYAGTCELIIRLFDQSFNQLRSTLEQMVSMGPTAFLSPNLPFSPEQLRSVRLEENRLTWLVYMIGALLNGRSTSSSGSLVDSDQLDGGLIAGVMRLLQFGDVCLNLILQLLQQDAQLSNPNVASVLIHISSGAIIRLELAIITFLERFRKIYIGDNISRATKMYQSLSDLVGISDETTILKVFVSKILLNLRYWSDHEVVLEPTLKIFGELASSFTAMKRLLTLEDVKFMLANHTPTSFRFLSTASSSSLSRYRSEFYAYLARLMLVTLSGIGPDDNRPFLDFLAPLTIVANSLISNLLISENCSISPEEARSNVIGLARDLAGVAFSLNTMASFQHFLDWFYPSLFSLFGRALELWPYDSHVTCPILKLLAEIANNRNDRLKFESTLPIGYLLLAEMTKILNNYGPRLIPFFSQVSEDNTYVHKIKPLRRYLDALRITLSEKYANFAIFGLVGDNSFEKSVKLSADMLLCVTDAELKSFIKLSKSYFALLEILTQNHMELLSSLDSSILRRFFSAIVIGVESLDSSVAWSACSCLDSILTHVYKLLYPVISPTTNGTSNGNHPNGSGMLNNHEQSKYPIFVPSPPSSLPTSEIAQAARQRLTACITGGVPMRGCCSALAIWSDRTEAGNANLKRDFLRQSSVGGVSEFTVTSRHLMITFLASFMNEECKNQWSISRPLLGLILLNQDYFSNLQRFTLNAVSPHQRAELEGIFGKLMDGVENNLFAKNRDRFTQNISTFRHALMEFMKKVSVKLMGDQQATAATYDANETFSLRSILLSSAASL
ncbi:unnamed protein product, partial [Hymenolepis diminuta]